MQVGVNKNTDTTRYVQRRFIKWIYQTFWCRKPYSCFHIYMWHMDSRWYTPYTNVVVFDTEVYARCPFMASRLEFRRDWSLHYCWEVMVLSPYNLDVTSIDFYLLEPLKMQLLRKRFWTDADVRQAVTSPQSFLRQYKRLRSTIGQMFKCQ